MQYKNITFAKEVKKTSLASFKKTFKNHKAFLEVPHLEREAELTRVWEKLTGKSATSNKDTRKRKKTNSAKS